MKSLRRDVLIGATRFGWAISLAMLLLAAVPVQSINVTLTASDPSGSDSWDEAGRWDNAAAPSSGNDYFTGTYQLRTPNSLAGNTSFAGGSLTINGGSLLYKGSGSRTITINNLTLDGGALINGNGGTTFTLAGNQVTVNTTGFFDSSADSTDRGVVINPPIAGAGTITSRGRGNVQIGNTASSFIGKWILQGNQTRLTADAVLGVVPGGYVADAVTIDGGILMNRDSEVVIPPNRGVTVTAAGGRIQAGWSKRINIDSVITGGGGLTILSDATPGLITLNGANDYTGPTTVQGWAQVNGTIGAASAVTVQSGGLLVGNGTLQGALTVSPNGQCGPGGLFAPGTLTVNSAVQLGDCTLWYDLSDSTTEGGNVNDLLVVDGDLTLSGTVTVMVTPLAGSLASGTYRLIQYTGSLIGSAANLVAAPSGYTLTFDTDTPGEVKMIVQSGSPADLVWQGDNLLNFWDLSTANWLGGGNAALFRNGDNVTIDDSGASLVPISIASPNLLNTLVPGAVTVNANVDYTLSGGRLAGPMTLTKQGSGLLILAAANTSLPNFYDGPTIIEEGQVRVGYPRALGSTLGGTYMRNGGSLDINGQSLGFEPVFIEGDGPGGAGALVNYAGTQQNALRQVTLTGNATVGGTGRFDLRGTPEDTFLSTGDQPYTLTKVGPQQFSLVGVTVDPALGDIDVLEGIISYEAGTTSLGDPTRTATFAPNAQLLLWNTVNPLDKIIVFNGGGTANIYNGSGASTIVGPITVNADSTWQVGGTSLTIESAIEGEGGLIKTGGSPLYLNGVNTYTGPTVVSSGSLVLGENASIAESEGILLASGSTFNVSAISAAAGAFELNGAIGQTLAGSGTVVGNVTAGNGTIVSAGTSAGTLTVNGNLSLEDGATAVLELGSNAGVVGGGVNDLVAVNGNLTFNGVITLQINALAPLDTINPYTVATYSGVLDAGAASLNIVSDSRYTFVVDPTAPNIIRVIATAIGTGVEDLTWQGGVSGSETLWDVVNTQNWSNSVAAPDLFYQGDGVRFDDTALSPLVDLVSTVTPSAVTVNNEAKDFLWSGPGKLSGTAGLTKQGAGTLTIDNAGINDNSGGTTIEAGTLEVGTGGTSGNLNSAAIVNNGTLIFNRSDDITVGNVISGVGTLEKQGAGTMLLNPANPAFAGPVAVGAGTLRLGNNGSLGSDAQGTTVADGATLDVTGRNLGAEVLTVAGGGVGGAGAILNNGGGQNNALRFVTLTGDTTFGGTGRWDIRTDAPATTAAALNGNGFNLTKVGPNENWLVNLGDIGVGDITIERGTVGIQGTTTMGDPGATLAINRGGTLGFYANNNAAAPLNKVVVMNSGTWINNNGDNYFAGPITLSGANTFTMSATLRLLGPIDGNGSLFKANSGTLVLGADNTYAGGTVVQAGYLRIGNGGTSGSIVGTVYNSGRVDIERSDTYTQSFNVVGTGGMGIRTAAGVVWDTGTSVDLTGTVEVGRDVAGTLIIQGTANARMGNLYLGNPANIAGEVLQTGGDIVVDNNLRIGHWPNETSTYTLEDGTITLPGTPAGGNEQAGIFYIGIDGTGIFTQRGGTVSAHGLVLDNRGNTAGDDTFNLEGGTFIVGPSGIGSGNLANTYVVNLAGGTLAASANWSSALNMNLTGVDTSPVIDTGVYTDQLSGNLSGVGGFTKRGAGTLILSGTSSHWGAITVEEGTLSILGTVGVGVGYVAVNGGTLIGTGTVGDVTVIEAGGTLAPGASIGTLTFGFVGFDPALTLAGTTVMEINRTGSTLSNDKVVAASGLVYGGVLTVEASGDPLADGDAFPLFESAAHYEAFAALNLPPLRPGLEWDTTTLVVDGTLRVKAVEPAQLTISISGIGAEQVIQIAWPEIYGNHVLQAQTNAMGTGITDQWVDFLNADNPLIIQPTPPTPDVFYRLFRP